MYSLWTLDVQVLSCVFIPCAVNNIAVPVGIAPLPYRTSWSHMVLIERLTARLYPHELPSYTSLPRHPTPSSPKEVSVCITIMDWGFRFPFHRVLNHLLALHEQQIWKGVHCQTPAYKPPFPSLGCQGAGVYAGQDAARVPEQTPICWLFARHAQQFFKWVWRSIYSCLETWLLGR